MFYNFKNLSVLSCPYCNSVSHVVFVLSSCCVVYFLMSISYCFLKTVGYLFIYLFSSVTKLTGTQHSCHTLKFIAGVFFLKIVGLRESLGTRVKLI